MYHFFAPFLCTLPVLPIGMSIHPFGKIIIETGNNIPFGSKEVSYTTLLFLWLQL